MLFFLAGANFWEKYAKNRQKHAKTGAFLVLIFLGGKLVGANFYAFCNYASDKAIDIFELPPSPSQIGIPNISSIFHHLDILDILDALTEISSDTDGRCAILMLIC